MDTEANDAFYMLIKKAVEGHSLSDEIRDMNSFPADYWGLFTAMKSSKTAGKALSKCAIDILNTPVPLSNLSGVMDLV